MDTVQDAWFRITRGCLDLPRRQDTLLIVLYGKDEADDLASERKRLISQFVAVIKVEG